MNQSGYKTVEILGVGTFGTVYKCLDANNNERCIKRIKLINTSRLASAVHNELVQQEIYLLQNLSHPRIISLYDYFFSNDGKYIHIVMEYARNGSLSKLISTKLNGKKTFEESEIRRMFIEILSGVEFLHIKNVIHKDIKPDNILVTDTGHLKIADFGVSKITNIENCDFAAMLESAKVKEIGGSPLYMAPETLVHSVFDFGSDIWALGCILYELCMLHSPFYFADSMEELIKCTTRRIMKPINAMYGKDLLDICDRMLMPNVNNRATMSDIISNPTIVIPYYMTYFEF